MKSLSADHVDEISSSLAKLESLSVPAKMAKDGCTQEQKISYLTALLQHDPGVFLERHGKLITPNQRHYFEPLRDDYEVNFYLMLLEDQGVPGADDKMSDAMLDLSVTGLNFHSQIKCLIACLGEAMFES